MQRARMRFCGADGRAPRRLSPPRFAWTSACSVWTLSMHLTSRNVSGSGPTLAPVLSQHRTAPSSVRNRGPTPFIRRTVAWCQEIRVMKILSNDMPGIWPQISDLVGDLVVRLPSIRRVRQGPLGGTGADVCRMFALGVALRHAAANHGVSQGRNLSYS